MKRKTERFVSTFEPILIEILSGGFGCLRQGSSGQSCQSKTLVKFVVERTCSLRVTSCLQVVRHRPLACLQVFSEPNPALRNGPIKCSIDMIQQAKFKLRFSNVPKPMTNKLDWVDLKLVLRLGNSAIILTRLDNS